MALNRGKELLWLLGIHAEESISVLGPAPPLSFSHQQSAAPLSATEGSHTAHAVLLPSTSPY